MTQRFEVWSTDGCAGKIFYGDREAENFQQACYRLAADDYAFRRKFNPLRLTYNGDKLYPSEQALIDSFIKQEA